VPCGLADRGVTSLTELAGRPVSVAEARQALLPRFEEVFGVRLVSAPVDQLPRVDRLDPVTV
ncbi:MAG: hypothetical protein ACRDHB_02880, partial [Actinomycetota bacterium]